MKTFKISTLTHKGRMAHIAELRKIFGTGRARKSPVPMPNLKDPLRGAALGNVLAVPHASTAKRTLPKDAKQFPVGNLHKSGLQLITPDMDLKYMSGKKAN